MKEFEEKYREVKVQTSREKVVNTHFSDAGVEECSMMSMGTDSMSRRIYQEVRNRSNMRREDSRGRAYFRSYEKLQSYQDVSKLSKYSQRAFFV